MQVVMALWLFTDLESYGDNFPFVDYTKVDYDKLHSCLKSFFKYNHGPKIYSVNDIIDVADWNFVIRKGEAYALEYLEEVSSIIINVHQRMNLKKVVNLNSASISIHKTNHSRELEPPPACLFVVVEDSDLINLREWILYCRMKFGIVEGDNKHRMTIAPFSGVKKSTFSPVGSLKEKDLIKLNEIFGVRFKKDVMFNFTSKKAMKEVLSIKKVN
jgi:hypothetical protein